MEFDKEVLESWHKQVRMIDIFIKTKRIIEAKEMMQSLVEAIDKEMAFEENHVKN